MNKKDVAYSIGAFIEKYSQNSNYVELPEWGFVIKQIFEVEVSEDSLKELDGDIWNFSATVKIKKTDSLATIVTTQSHDITGMALISFYKDQGVSTLNPETKHIIISNIK